MDRRITDAPKRTWRELYQAALAEADPTELRRKIDLACAAILTRIYLLAARRDPHGMEEQREILDSLNNLQKIQRAEFCGSEEANQAAPSGGKETSP